MIKKILEFEQKEICSNRKHPELLKNGYEGVDINATLSAPRKIAKELILSIRTLNTFPKPLPLRRRSGRIPLPRKKHVRLDRKIPKEFKK